MAAGLSIPNLDDLKLKIIYCFIHISFPLLFQQKCILTAHGI